MYLISIFVIQQKCLENFSNRSIKSLIQFETKDKKLIQFEIKTFLKQKELKMFIHSLKMRKPKKKKFIIFRLEHEIPEH